MRKLVAVIGGGLLLLWFFLRGKGGGLSAPPLVQAPPAPLVPNGGELRGKGGGIAGILAQVGEYLASDFHNAQARAVWDVGVALGITVGAINIVAGIVVFAVIATVAMFMELATVLSDGDVDNHEAGLEAFQADWQKCFVGVREALLRRAATDTGGSELAVESLAKVERAAAAYADGFMQRTNYYRCTSCLQLSASRSVYAGWMNGQYASEQSPALTSYGVQYLWNGNPNMQGCIGRPDLVGADGAKLRERATIEEFSEPSGFAPYRGSQGIYGAKVFRLASPIPRTYVPEGEWTEPSWGKSASSDAFVCAWGRLGTAHADAAAVRRALDAVADGGILTDLEGLGADSMLRLRGRGMWMGVYGDTKLKFGLGPNQWTYDAAGQAVFSTIV